MGHAVGNVCTNYLSCELYCKAFRIGMPTNQPTNLASDLLLNKMVLPLVVEDHMNLLRTRTTDIGACKMSKK